MIFKENGVQMVYKGQKMVYSHKRNSKNLFKFLCESWHVLT